MTGYDERLIQVIDARIAKAAQSWTARGTVVDRDTSGPGATVVFDGDAIAMPVKVLGHVHILEGDRVVLTRVATTWVVVGTFARRQLAGTAGRGFGPNPAQVTSSASFVDMPVSAGVNITKRYDLTTLKFTLVWTGWASVADTDIRTGVRFAGKPGTDTAATFTAVDYLLGKLQLDTAFVRGTCWSQVRISNVPAGEYVATPRWRRDAGTGELRMDDRDLVSCEVDELY